jgi:hypothetical protein
VTDQDPAKRHEYLVDVGASFPADAQAAELMRPGESAFDDPASRAQTAAMWRSTLGQIRRDAAGAQLVTMRIGIVTTIALHPIRPAARVTYATGDGRDAFDQHQQLGHVVASPESILVPVKLEVTEELCICTCHADPRPACDGIYDIQSIRLLINVAFRGALDVGEATCPVSFADANCDCNVDVLDVVRIIDFVWRSGPPLCNPCTDVVEPCGLTAR